MGSVTSRPKVPATVSIPAPVVAAPVASAPVVATPSPSLPSSSGAGSTAATPTAADIAQGVRDDNLLQRGRGALSTVLTSFRGVLDDNIAPKQQKTLLGE